MKPLLLPLHGMPPPPPQGIAPLAGGGGGGGKPPSPHEMPAAAREDDTVLCSSGGLPGLPLPRPRPLLLPPSALAEEEAVRNRWGLNESSIRRSRVAYLIKHAYVWGQPVVIMTNITRIIAMVIFSLLLLLLLQSPPHPSTPSSDVGSLTSSWRPRWAGGRCATRPRCRHMPRPPCRPA